MWFKLFVCPVCGVVKLQNKSVGEYPPPMCNGDGARVHSSTMSFVYEVDFYGRVKATEPQ